MEVEGKWTMRFDGETYVPERDQVRLARQWWAVWSVMKDGRWRTLTQLAEITGYPEASVSARLRDFRKPRFGAHLVERQYVVDGLWAYRLEPSPRVEVVAK